jgi:acetyl-CoA synthetase
MPKIESLLREKRIFKANPEFAKRANWNRKTVNAYRKLGEKNPEQFWANMAAEHVTWFTPWKETLRWKPPFAKWFIGGKLNVSYNCLDRHLQGENAWRRNKAAIIWEGEPGDSRVITFAELHREVCKCANVLKELGVRKGDRVALYMPMIPELAIAMLACSRIGAPHNIVFGGFSAEALRERIEDAGAKLVITADGGFRRGEPHALKNAVDEALEGAPVVEKVVVVRRTGDPTAMQSGRDHWWHDLMADASAKCPPAKLDAEHPLFILYTSGTTGKPKGILHTTGGYLTHVTTTAKAIFDLKDEDTFWCSADIGWVTGHSYRSDASGARPFLVHHREVRGERLLHRPHGDPRLHPPGRRTPEKARPVVTSPPGHRGRTHQSRGLDVVSPSDRRQALPHRRHLVADGDGRHPDNASPRCRGDQTGVGHASLPGHRRRCLHRRGRARGASRRRLPGAAQAVARDAAGDLGRPEAIPGAVLECVPRHVLHR